MKRIPTMLGLVAGSLMLSSCSLVPTTSSPQIIARHDIPFGLLGQSIPGTNGGRVRFITQPVYIVDVTGHLAPSSRIVPAPPTLATVLRQLILGPTQIESAAGYSSALPKDLVLIDATVKNTVGFIDLATALTSLSRAQQLLAIGQLVLTANDVGATGGIRISVAGIQQSVLLPNGHHSALASAKDFQLLLNN